MNFRVICTLLVLGVAGASALAQSLASVSPADGKAHAFELKQKQFFIDGQPTMILAGEMHFGRMLPEFFEQRIRQAHAMGLNAISLYLFWNQVEPHEGKFDFTGGNDVRRFVQLCQKNGMWVILRPGPYCCAETEFGGLPWWLLKDPTLKPRSNDPKFLKCAQAYVTQVGKQVADLQVSHGGPLLMTQIDNEYGRVDDYMRSMQKIFVDAGFDGQLFTCDHSNVPLWKGNQTLPGVLHCRNGLKDDAMLAESTPILGDYPVFSPEIYTAWFSIWAGPLAKKPIDDQLQWTNWLLDHNVSFSLYMFHGGTNYGFTNGSNQWRPIVTSYDYDAPVDEAGRVTPKYKALRELISKRFKIEPPPIPDDPKIIEIPEITLDSHAPLVSAEVSGEPRVSENTCSMEELDQGYGFVLYRKQFDGGLSGTIELNKAQDYALVSINGKTVGRSFVGLGPDSAKVKVDEKGPVTLDILVYNLGRISSPFNAAQGHKGLLGGATFNGQPLTGWQIHSLPMDHVDLFKPSGGKPEGPEVYHGQFTLDETGETFLDLRNWSFGVVYVNGHNLGRYWDRGGLRSLYLPSVWQKKGTNTIDILELQDAPTKPTVTGVKNIVEEPAKAFAFEPPKRR